MGRILAPPTCVMLVISLQIWTEIRSIGDRPAVHVLTETDPAGLPSTVRQQLRCKPTMLAPPCHLITLPDPF